MLTEQQRADLEAQVEKREAQLRTDAQRALDERAIEREMEEGSKRGWFADSGLGVYRGLLKASKSVFELVGELDERLTRRFGGVYIGIEESRPVVGLIKPQQPTIESLITGKHPGDEIKSLLTLSGHNVGRTLTEVLPETETLPGKASDVASQFLVGFIPAARALKTVSALNTGSKLSTASRFVLADAAAAFTVFDGQEARLSNLVQSSPTLANPITEYLAADPDDDELHGRLKNVIENALIAGALGVGFKMTAKGYELAKSQASELADAIRALSKARRAKTAHAEADEIAAANDIPAKSLDETTPEPSGNLADKSPSPTSAESVPAEAVDATARISAETIESSPFVRIQQEIAADPKRAEALADRLLNAKGNPEGIARDVADIGLNARRIDWQSFDDPKEAGLLFNLTAQTYQSVIENAGVKRVKLEETILKAAEVRGELTAEELAAGLSRRVLGEGGIAANLLAGRTLLMDSADQLLTLKKSIDAGEASDVLKAEFVSQLQRHAAIDAMVKGAKSEVARALNAMKIIAKARAGTVTELRDTVKSLGFDLDDPRWSDAFKGAKTLDEVTQGVRRVARGRSAFWQVVYGGLLSNPVTHAANIVGNMGQALLSLADNFVAAGIGSLRRLSGTAKGSEATFRDAAEYAVGYASGIKQALALPLASIAKQAIDSGFTWRGTRQYLAELAEAEKLGTFWQTLGTGRPVTDVMQKAENLSQTSVYFDVKLPKWSEDPQGFLAAASRGLHKIAANVVIGASTVPTRALSVADELFTKAAYTARMNQLAYRHARQLRETLGAQGVPAEQIEKRIASEMEDLMHGMRDDAIHSARRATFRDAGEIAEAAQKLLNAAPAARLLFPFVTTPASIIRQVAFDRTGLTMLSRGAKSAAQAIKEAPNLEAARRELLKRLAEGGEQADLVAARALVGWTFIVSALSWAASGRLRGSGPRGRDTGEFAGVAAGSIKLGDSWYQVSRLDPIGGLLILVADMRDAVEAARSEGEELDLTEASAAALIAYMKGLHSKSFMTGFSTLVHFMDSPESGAEKLLQQLGATFVPLGAGLAAVERIEDPIIREADGVLDHIRSRLPGLSGSDLPAARDWLGRARRVEDPTLINPARVTHESDDPLDRELGRLAFRYSMPPKRLGSVELTARQYTRLLELRGQVRHPATSMSLEEHLRKLVTSPRYTNPANRDEDREDALKDLAALYGRHARERLIAEEPELAAAVGGARLERGRGANLAEAEPAF